MMVCWWPLSPGQLAKQAASVHRYYLPSLVQVEEEAEA